MRKWWAILLAVVLCMSGCAVKKGERFTADVEQINGNTLVVVALEGEEVRRSSDKFTLSVENGSDFSVGDRVEITFDGMIQELYPAILPNVYSVEKVDK